eukprot:9861240-Heterocapsa_arctica.AAC.1
MIDLTQFDENISLPPKFFKNNYDVQNIGIVQDRATDVESPSGTPPPEQPAPRAAPPTSYNIYDSEDDN